MAWVLLTLFWAQSPIRILSADQMGGTPHQRILHGNVALQQDTITLYCHEALLTSDGGFTASGGTLTSVGNAGKIQAAQILYNPYNRVLIYEHNVEASFPPSLFRAPRLLYAREEGKLYYLEGGSLLDTAGHIQSQRGYYDAHQAIAYFAGQVRLSRENVFALTDTMVYETSTYLAIFPKSVAVYDPLHKDTLEAQKAQWYRERGEVFLDSLAEYRDTARIVKAERAYYHMEKDSGWAYCSFRYVARRGLFRAWADTAIWQRDTLWLRGNAAILLEEDTHTHTFLQAEEIWSTGTRIYARGQVEVLRPPLLARSDSLVYDTTAAWLFLIGRVWLGDTSMQLQARQVFIQFQGSIPDSAHAVGNVRLISPADTFLSFYQQVKGDSAYALWNTEEGHLYKIYFRKHVQALYHQREEQHWQGTHYIQSQGLLAYLKPSQQIERLILEGRPHVVFYPVRLLISQTPWIQGMRWMDATERPHWPFLMKEAH